jgi:hypothetical protein
VEHESSVGDWQFLHAAGEHLHDSPDPLLPLAFLLLKFEDAMALQQHKRDASDVQGGVSPGFEVHGVLSPARRQFAGGTVSPNGSGWLCGPHRRRGVNRRSAVPFAG